MLPYTRRAVRSISSRIVTASRRSASVAPGSRYAGPEKQSREQLDAVEAAYAAIDAASRGDDALAAEIVSVGVFEASQRRREALLARNVTEH